ncbi:MAG: cysteine-rich CWC family protein [Burkholderiales bacterium]
MATSAASLPQRGPSSVKCPLCDAVFSCGAAASSCWCVALPPLANIVPARGCLCPACLKRCLDQESGTAAPPAVPGH